MNDQRGNTVCGASGPINQYTENRQASPSDPVLREQFENILNRLHLCTVNAREIESKIFNPAPVRENDINEKSQPNIENLLTGLYHITSELEDTLARVNSKL